MIELELENALASVLRMKRTQLNFTQEELAHLCNLDRTYISLLERSKRKPTLSTLFKICDILSITPGEFIYEIETIWLLTIMGSLKWRLIRKIYGVFLIKLNH